MTRPHAGVCTSAAIAYALVAVALLLWPYRFSSPAKTTHNGVHWLPSGGGVEFHAPGVIRGAGGANLVLEALAAGEGFGVEVWATSASENQTGPARIVGSSTDVDLRNFTLGQERDALAVRLRTDRTNPNGTPGLRVANVFARGALRHLVVAYDGETLRVWVDGRLRAETREPGGHLGVWNPEYPLLLGNEATGTRPWLGRLYRVALYARPLGSDDAAILFAAGPRAAQPEGRAAEGLVALYRFEAGGGEHVVDVIRTPGAGLEIPAAFRIGERKLLAWRDRGRPLDRGVNAVILIPFGFALERALAGRRRRTALGLGIALAFALGVESAQFFLEDRTSSTVDAVLNVLGSGIGMALGRSPRVAGLAA